MSDTSVTSPPGLDELGKNVGQLLAGKRQTVAVAESSTGGLISAALLAVPGASNYFRAGSVVYTRQAWTALLRSSIDIAGSKPLSEATALHLAKTIRTQLDTTWGVGEIGAAGPTGTRYGDPAGLSCIAVVGPNFAKSLTIKTDQDNRVANMWAFTQAALALLGDALR